MSVRAGCGSAYNIDVINTFSSAYLRYSRSAAKAARLNGFVQCPYDAMTLTSFDALYVCFTCPEQVFLLMEAKVFDFLLINIGF